VYVVLAAYEDFAPSNCYVEIFSSTSV